MKTSEISKFEALFLTFLKTSHMDLLNEIGRTGDVTDEQLARLDSIIPTFIDGQNFV